MVTEVNKDLETKNDELIYQFVCENELEHFILFGVKRLDGKLKGTMASSGATPLEAAKAKAIGLDLFKVYTQMVAACAKLDAVLAMPGVEASEKLVDMLGKSGVESLAQLTKIMLELGIELGNDPPVDPENN